LRAIVLFHPNKTYRFNYALASFGIGSKLKYLAGSETGAGMFINDTLAEEKAAELRSKVTPVEKGG